MNLIEKVRQYYEFVDSNKFEKLFSLFSRNIVYLRCEEKIEGIGNLRKFYLKDRKIKGKHELNKIIQSKKTIIVQGVFKGKNSKGNEIVLSFADFFDFDDSGKIEKRYTYLASGYKSTI